MAASNVTIDDTSPLFRYDPAGAWAHESGSDETQSYVNSTFSRTTVEGATAQFSFEGTGFWLYGAKRDNYGQYILILDDQVTSYANATSKDAQVQQVLGGASGLENKQHTVKILSAGGGLVDIDAIVYETTNQEAINSAPKLTAGSGAPTSTSGTSRAKSTGRLSANPNAVGGPDDTASNGDVAQPSATPNADGDGQSNASTDGQQNAPPPDGQQTNGQQNAPPADGQQNAPTDGQPPASTDGQPNVPTNGPPLNGDGTVAPAPSSVTPPPSTTPVQTPSSTASILTPTISQAERQNDNPVSGTAPANRGLPLGAIIGIAIGSAIILLLLIVLLFVCLRRRKAKARRQREVALPSPILPLQNPDVEGGYFFGGRGSMAPAPKSNPMREKYLAQTPMTQPRGGGATVQQGRGPSPYAEQGYSDFNGMPRPLPPATLRDSSYASETATLVSEDGYGGYDITEMYSKMPPTRPQRPPELRLSV